MKKCMYCGQENEDQAFVCIKCGNTLLDIPTDRMPPLEEAGSAAPAAGQEADALPQSEADAAAAGNPAYTQGGSPYPQSNDQGYTGAPYGQDGQGYTGAPYGQDAQGYASAPYGQNGQGYAGVAYAQGEQGYAGAAYGYGASAPYGMQPASEQRTQPEPQEYEEEIDESVPSPAMMESARKRVHSPLFFLSVLCYTVSVIGSIVYSVTGGRLTNLSTLSNTIKAFIGENIALGYFDRLVVWLQAQDTANRILSRAVSGAIYLPAVLIMIGLWMAFSGISPRRDEAHTSGLTLARVILILQFIVVCIALLAGIGVCVAYVVAAGAAQTMMTLIVGVVALLVMVIFTVLTILYYIQLLFSIRVVRTNCRSGLDIGRIPGFVIFVGLIGCLITTASALMMAPDDYIGLASRGAGAVWLLFITIWGIVYRATVKP